MYQSSEIPISISPQMPSVFALFTELSEVSKKASKPKLSLQRAREQVAKWGADVQDAEAVLKQPDPIAPEGEGTAVAVARLHKAKEDAAKRLLRTKKELKLAEARVAELEQAVAQAGRKEAEIRAKLAALPSELVKTAQQVQTRLRDIER